MKKVLSLILVLVMCLSLCACGGDKTAEIFEGTDSAEESENSTNRLDSLRQQKADDIAKEEAEKAAEREKEAANEAAEEARRQEIRNSITENEALLDEIVGEWGFVSPLWAGETPDGYKTAVEPEICFFIFSEYGTVARYRARADTKGGIIVLDDSGQFALDENNNTLYIILDDKNQEIELRYEYKDEILKMYSGFYADASYSEAYKTELFKANWGDLLAGIGRQEIDFIQAVADENPQFVPDFFKQSKDATNNTQLSDALVGQWGTATPTWMENGYKCRPQVFCYDFTKDGKVTLTYTASGEDGTQEMSGVYYWNERENTITLSFIKDSAKFSYSLDNDTFVLMGGYYNGVWSRFSQEGAIEFFKADWSTVFTEISNMNRERLDDYIYEFLKEHPEYKADFFSKK